MSEKSIQGGRAALAGLVGGSVATLALHPLDLLKIRQSVHCNGVDAKARAEYSSVIRACKGILKSQGGVKGLYAGCGANVIVSGSSWGVYFTSYAGFKSVLPKTGSATADELSAATGAGIVTTTVTNPMSVVRTRMVMADGKNKAYDKYSSIFGTVKHILKSEGLRGMYKGIFPAVLNVTHGSLQFILYEDMKRRFVEQTGEKPNVLETLGFCTASKLIAAVVTYPCQNLRSIQQATEKVKVSGGNSSEIATVPATTAMSLMKREGLRGLYRGLVPYLMHVVPNVCVVFTVYELVKDL